MAWICEACSSNNEDRSRECFVCGTRRSMRAIRRAKREARHRKFIDVSAGIIKGVLIGATVQLITAAALFGGAGIFLLAKQMIEGEASLLLVDLFKILRHAWGNVADILPHNIPEMLKAFSGSTLITAFLRYFAMCWQMLNKLLQQLGLWITELFGARILVHLIDFKDAIGGIIQRMIQGIIDIKNGISGA